MKIMRKIVEIFEVEAKTFDEAVEMIQDGKVLESEPLSDEFEEVK